MSDLQAPPPQPTDAMMPSLIQAISDPVLVISLETERVGYCNQAAESFWGYTCEEMGRLSVEALVKGGHEAIVAAVRASSGGESGASAVVPVEAEALLASGEGMSIQLTVCHQPAEANANASVSMVVRRAMPERRRVDKDEIHAFYDQLTGLPNRYLFLDRLMVAISQAKRLGWRVAVLYLDLDQFNVVNNTLGHDMGDLLLSMIAERLSNCVRDYDTVARFGGDEFLLILTGITCDEDVVKAAQRVKAALAPPFELNGHELFVTATLGISQFPDNSDNEKELVKYAYLAKEHAREQLSGFELFAADVVPRVEHNLKLRNCLHKAVEREQFLLHYQPQVDIRTGRIIGAEALIRWQSPELGFVSPLDFISLAEEMGLINPLTEWVLRQACRQAKEWEQLRSDPFRVAVNLSGKNFKQKNLLEMISDILRSSGLPPKHLELEITENALMQNVDRASEMLEALTSLGVVVSLDDFGTGYSSLSYLRRFPLTTLKIDRSFVRELEFQQSDAMIVRAIIALAHSLDLKVIAEGVENRDQLECLRKLGCDQVQGFYFSRPVPAEAFTAMLMADKPLGPIL